MGTIFGGLELSFLRVWGKVAIWRGGGGGGYWPFAAFWGVSFKTDFSFGSVKILGISGLD